MSGPRVCVIACGALAREITTLIGINQLDHITLRCLPAMLHNTPGDIPGAVEAAIIKAGAEFDEILVAYGDCGTGGRLDNLLDAYGVRRIEGPHCYSFYHTNQAFAAREQDDLGAFYLTDFLVRQFNTLVIRPLGLDRHPQLRDIYFGNYRKLVYLAQTDDANLVTRAQAAAQRLALKYEHRQVGYGALSEFLTHVPPPIQSHLMPQQSPAGNHLGSAGDTVNV